MQSAQEFMQEFFRARTADIQRELERRAGFRRKFFAEACRWDSREGDVARSESETIESVLTSDSGAWVVTREGDLFVRFCYQLKMSSGSWIIEDVAVECISCRGQARDPGCCFCAGTGWMRLEDLRATRARLEKEKSE